MVPDQLVVRRADLTGPEVLIGVLPAQSLLLDDHNEVVDVIDHVEEADELQEDDAGEHVDHDLSEEENVEDSAREERVDHQDRANDDLEDVSHSGALDHSFEVEQF